MSLSDVTRKLQEYAIADNFNIEESQLIFATYKSGGKRSVRISCDVVPIQPFESSFCRISSQYIFNIEYQYDYSIMDKRGSDLKHLENIDKILNQFSVNKKLNDKVSGLSIYKPPSVSPWFDKDSKRTAVISVYFQVEKGREDVKN